VTSTLQRREGTALVTLPPRRRLPLGLTPTHVGAIAVGVGVFALFLSFISGPVAGLLVIGVAVALPILMYAVMSPTVAVSIVIGSEFVNLSGVLNIAGLTIGTLALALASVVVGFLRPTYRERVQGGWWYPAGLLMAYLLAIIPASILSETPTATALVLDDWLKNLLMLVVVLVLMQMSGRPWVFVAAMVVPMSVICVMMGLNQYVIGNAFTFGGFSQIASAAGDNIAAARHSGPMADSNFWGRVLLLGMPGALALAHRAWKARKRLALSWWLLESLLLLGGIYLTQSRGTLIATAVALVVWIVAVGPQVRKMAMWLIPVALAGLLLPGIGDRLLTVTSALSGPDYAADASVVERGNVYTVALKIFEENPIFGTGPASFATEIGLYAPETSAGSTGDITATHNLYLEIGSETGVVGLVGWGVFIIGMLTLGIRAVMRMAGAREDGPQGRPTRALAAAGVAGIVGFSVASVFLHMAFPRTLLLTCAVVGMLYSTTRADVRLRRPAAVDATRRAVKGLRFGVVASIATAIAAVLVAGTLLTALSRTTYEASADLTLQATPETFPGYALDVRRRVEVLPTYASVIQNAAPQSGTTVAADPPRGVMTVTATGNSAEEAVARRDAITNGAQAAIEKAGMAAAYKVVTVTVAAPQSHIEITSTLIRIALIATLVEILVVITLCARIRREERRQGVWLI
jgi:O-antigen ligase